ncbi:MAG: hypothetical protein RL514_2235 [Verrucomicrobiota bacterium]|jgi:hypothetical protein
MQETELRALIRESIQRPVRLCLDDGRSYTITHPDFGMVANQAIVLGSGPGHDLGGPNFVICYFDHVTRVEVLDGKAKAA